MTRVLLDANVFLHALGGHVDLRPACRTILGHVGSGVIKGEASTLVIDEVVHVRHRRLGDRRLAVKDGRSAATLCRLHAVTEREIDAALSLFGAQPRLQMRDAVHVATAQHHDLSVVISTDRGLDGVPGLRRVDPADAAAVQSLLAG